MLITKDFIFLHIPKTGGVSLRTAIRRFWPRGYVVFDSEPTLGRHASWVSVPSRFKGLPTFALVRNPWDWYVSWYQFQRRGYLRGFSGDPYFMLCSQNLARNFNDTLFKVLEPPAADGYFTNLVRDLIPTESGATLVESERMGNGFQAFLESHQIKLPAGLLNFLNTRRLNARSSPRHGQYYSEALAQKVAIKDKALIERFGYRLRPESLSRESEKTPRGAVVWKGRGPRQTKPRVGTCLAELAAQTGSVLELVSENSEVSKYDFFIESRSEEILELIPIFIEEWRSGARKIESEVVGKKWIPWFFRKLQRYSPFGHPGLILHSEPSQASPSERVPILKCRLKELKKSRGETLEARANRAADPSPETLP